MISIRIGDEYLDLNPDTVISLRDISPVFEWEIKDVIHTLSFTIPYTENNERIFRMYSSPNAFDTLICPQAVIYFDWIRMASGQLAIKDGLFPANTYSVRFEGSLAPIAETIKGLKISDLFPEKINISSSQPLYNADLLPTRYNPNTVLSIIINGKEFSEFWYTNDPLGELVCLRLSQQINSGGIGVLATRALLNDPRYGISLTSTSGDPIDFQTNPPSNQNAWSVIDTDFSQTELHSSIIAHMNQTNIGNPWDKDYIFTPVYNPDFYNGENPDYLGYMNLYDPAAASFVANTTTEGERFRNTAVPFVRFGAMLSRALDHIGYVDISGFTQTEDWRSLFMYNNVSIDSPQFYENTTLWNPFDTTLTLSRHIPKDFTLSDLLIFMRDTFNLMIKVDPINKEINFIKKQTLPKNPVTDMTGKTLVTYKISRPCEEDGYLLKYAEDDLDKLSETGQLSYQISEYQTGNGGEEIESQIGPLAFNRRSHPMDEDKIWLTPWIQQAGSSVLYGLEENEYNPRVFFARGNHPDSDGQTYPLGTHADKDYGGNIVGKYSLAHNPLFSNQILIHEFWEPWLSRISGRVNIEQQVLITLAEYLSGTIENPLRLQSQEGVYMGLIMQRNITMSMQGFNVATFKIRRI